MAKILFCMGLIFECLVVLYFFFVVIVVDEPTNSIKKVYAFQTIPFILFIAAILAKHIF